VISAAVAKVMGGVIAVLIVLLIAAGFYVNHLTDQLVTARADVKNWERIDRENRDTFKRELADAHKRAQDERVRHAAEIKATIADMEETKRQRERARRDAERLRLPASVCPAHPATDAGTRGSPAGGDGAAGIELPEEIERRLRDLAEDADRNTDQLRACQNVIRADRAVINNLSRKANP
jgi:prophage endopeptidase